MGKKGEPLQVKELGETEAGGLVRGEKGTISMNLAERAREGRPERPVRGEIPRKCPEEGSIS